uniref:Uncharacterized protein n=1 Tax=Anguilla anguilla TaxID=7936 RepID=A0A0E9VQ09_ANGAN
MMAICHFHSRMTTEKQQQQNHRTVAVEWLIPHWVFTLILHKQ